MAMAEVFFPDCDDHMNGGYPRAPPPSPEMQPCNHSRVFEIPASKFEGIGLDMRRNTFPLMDDDDESPLGPPGGVRRHRLGGPATSYEEEERGSLPVHSRNFDDDNSLPGSPQKRVCCSPCTLPNECLTTAFPSSSKQDSLVSSGFGSFQLPPLHISTGGGFRSNPGSLSGSSSPFIRSSRLYPQTSPCIIAERSTGAVQGSANQCTPALYPVTTPSHQDHTLMSHSYDLHSIHPHLPHSFETTQLPEVRPSRSRTLDSTAYPPLGLEPNTLDADCGEYPNQRRRKISVKRKNPDEDEGDDSNLQFSFEYSYSSAGSGEADWVMVDCKMDSSLPTGKKACCTDDPSSVAVSHQKGLRTSPLQVTPLTSFSPAGGRGLFAVPSHLNPLDHTPLSSGSSSTGFSPFASVATTTSHFTGQQVGVSFDRVDTPTNNYTNLPSFESLTMMDNDVMECEQFSPLLSPYGMFGGVVSGHMTQGAMNAPVLGMAHGLAVMRPHHREDAALGPAPSAALRHSCVEEYLQSHKGQGLTVGVEAGLGLNGDDPDLARLNLSKSL